MTPGVWKGWSFISLAYFTPLFKLKQTAYIEKKVFLCIENNKGTDLKMRKRSRKDSDVAGSPGTKIQGISNVNLSINNSDPCSSLLHSVPSPAGWCCGLPPSSPAAAGLGPPAAGASAAPSPPPPNSCHHLSSPPLSWLAPLALPHLQRPRQRCWKAMLLSVLSWCLILNYIYKMQ